MRLPPRLCPPRQGPLMCRQRPKAASECSLANVSLPASGSSLAGADTAGSLISTIPVNASLCHADNLCDDLQSYPMQPASLKAPSGPVHQETIKEDRTRSQADSHRVN